MASDTTDNLGKLMEDKVTLHLTVKGDEAAIKGALDAVDGVENIEYTDSEEKGCVDVMIQSDPKTEVREMIFYRLAAVQCPIYAMNQMKKSLEDVFIELTAEGTETSAKAQNNEDPHEEDSHEDELHEEDHEEHEEHPGETDETDEEDGKEAAEHDSDFIKKELRSYFTSMTGYICMAFMLVVIGIYFCGDQSVFRLSVFRLHIVLRHCLIPFDDTGPDNAYPCGREKPEDGSAAFDGACFTLENCHW